jgi:hypothetical protein
VVQVKNLGRPVVGLALDPNDYNRLYAAMVNSTTGGIYRTVNLDAGVASTWTKLATPPRTQGHPYNIVVLNDGTLVATYSARIASGNFQPSSGVFVSTTDGASWVDRSAAGMQYYTKDSQSIPMTPPVLVCSRATRFVRPRRFRTTNRGVTWTRITTGLKAVGSYLSPVNWRPPYATEDQGLNSANRRATAPVFTQLAAIRSASLRASSSIHTTRTKSGLPALATACAWVG